MRMKADDWMSLPLWISPLSPPSPMITARKMRDKFDHYEASAAARAFPISDPFGPLLRAVAGDFGGVLQGSFRRFNNNIC